MEELDKSVRILQGFTQQGFVRQEEQEVSEDGKSTDGKPVPQGQQGQVPASRTQKIKKKVNVIRKVWPLTLQKRTGRYLVSRFADLIVHVRFHRKFYSEHEVLPSTRLCARGSHHLVDPVGRA